MEQFGPVILFILFHFSYHLQLFDESFDRINEREQTSNLDRPEKTKFIEREQRRKLLGKAKSKSMLVLVFGIWFYFVGFLFFFFLSEMEWDWVIEKVVYMQGLIDS